MDEGAVAVIDALGFKGIWRREDVKHDESAFIAALKGLRPKLEQHVAESRSPILPFKYELSFLSDTIVIATVADFEKSGRPGHPGTRRSLLDLAVARCAVLSTHLMRMAADEPLRLSFRGCITVGSFVVAEHILLGPAIDEAAALHQHADGAFVWLAPSALQAIEYLPGQHGESATVPWTVPLKQGNSIETRAVSPFLRSEGKATRRALRERILRTFEPNLAVLDVWIKRQHTRAFLDAVSGEECESD